MNHIHLMSITSAIVIVSSACAVPAIAQEAATQEGRRALAESFEKAQLVNSGGPLEKEAAGGGSEEGIEANLQLAAIDGFVAADFSLAYTFGDVNVGQQDSGGDYRIKSVHRHLNLKGSVPINKKEAGSFADFKKLGNDAKLGLSFTSYNTSRVSGAGYQRELKKFAKKCLMIASDKWVEDQFPEATEDQKKERTDLLASFDKFAAQDPSSWAGATDKATKAKDDRGKLLSPNLGPVALSACGQGKGVVSDQTDLEMRFAKLTLSEPGEYEAFRSKYRNSSGVFFWGLAANAGYQKFDILNRPAFSIATADRVGFDGNVYVGNIASSGSFAWRVSGGYARGYERKGAVDFCRPAVGGTQECINGQDGLPSRKSTAYAKAEGRFVLLRDAEGKPRFAIAPEVAFDVKEKEFVFDLPIYLQRNKDKTLDAGIRFGYETKDNDFGVGVFVGIPLGNLF